MIENEVSNNEGFWPTIGLVYLLFWYLTSATQLLLLISGINGFEGIKDTTLTAFIWLIPVLIFPQSLKKVTGSMAFVIWLFALPAFGYFLIYKQELSQSLIFIIFESNKAESSEYLGNYFSFSILFYIVLFSLIPFYLWKKIPGKLCGRRNAHYSIAVLIILLFFAYPVFKAFKTQHVHMIYKSLNKHLMSAPPWQMIFGYANYQRELKEVESFLMKFNHTQPLQNFSEQKKPLPTTVVIVIGESSNRLHFSLYGYHRNTNPKLTSIKHELMVFKNVFASRPNTIESLEQVLTFADQQHPDLYKTKPTLIAMMKQAGYKTFWISNQQTLTSRNTILTTFAKQTDKQVWLNNTRSQNSYSFDEKVLQPFGDLLKDNAPKKLIIVHLIGTHMSYQYRYPKTFDYFKDSKALFKGLSEDKINKINAYDNAVRYNDTIVYELIKRLKATEHHSLLTYFSDHGDDVYDSGKHDFQGRNEDAPTLAMYAVPFIVWTSENWFNKHHLSSSKILNRQYDNADFIYTWSNLLGMSYQGYDQAKSIFSDSLVDDEIIVGDPYHQNKLHQLEGTK